MHHTGTLFMSKAKPEAGKAEDGAFRLTLQLIDRLGAHETQVYRVRWEGPAAEAFWLRHVEALTPGAVLHAELTRLRVYVGATYPPVPELRGRVTALQMGAKRLPGEREQLSKQEHSADTAAEA